MKRITPFFNGFDQLIDSLKYREISIYNIKVKIDYNQYTFDLIDIRLLQSIYNIHIAVSNDIVDAEKNRQMSNWADIMMS